MEPYYPNFILQNVILLKIILNLILLIFILTNAIIPIAIILSVILLIDDGFSAILQKVISVIVTVPKP